MATIDDVMELAARCDAVKQELRGLMRERLALDVEAGLSASDAAEQLGADVAEDDIAAETLERAAGDAALADAMRCGDIVEARRRMVARIGSEGVDVEAAARGYLAAWLTNARPAASSSPVRASDVGGTGVDPSAAVATAPGAATGDDGGAL